jgi:competence protein ComEC
MKELQFPLIRISLFFVLGIILYPYFTASLYQLIGIAISLVFFLVVFIYKKTFHNLSSLFLFILAIITGLTSVAVHDVNWNPTHFLHLTETQHRNEIKVELGEKLKSTSTHVRYEATVKEIKGVPTDGKIVLSIQNQKELPYFEYGTKLKFISKINTLKPANNPDQFDYKGYLENKSIFGQIQVELKDLSMAPPSHYSIRTFASGIRNSILQNLEKSHFSKEELPVFAALLLGQQQDITKDILQDYQYAGAIHILSVSGLHVGLLLGFLTLLLSPLPQTRKYALLKLGILLFSLSFFGILAGLSPSVLRSVTMFSFVAIGMYFRRSTNIYNTLLISAFLLLLFNPSYVYDVGFQLSYLALFFIVWLQPILSAWYQPKNKIVKSLWEIITVSTAAQIGTLPLSLYYFHQFSGLFFITNLIILPLLSVIMGVGVVVVLMAATNSIWIPLLKLMELSIWVINTIIHKIASFEQFIIKDIPFHKGMLLGLYLIICLFIRTLKKPNYKNSVALLLSLIFFQLVLIAHRIETENKDEFVVFSKNKSSLFTEKIGSKMAVHSDEDETQNSTLLNYATAQSATITSQKKIKNLYYFHSKKIVVLDSSCVYLPKTQPDVLVLIQSPKINLETLIQLQKPKQIVADRSNYKSYVARWKATCAKEKIPFHAIAEKGYYKMD